MCETDTTLHVSSVEKQSEQGRLSAMHDKGLELHLALVVCAVYQAVCVPMRALL